MTLAPLLIALLQAAMQPVMPGQAPGQPPGPSRGQMPSTAPMNMPDPAKMSGIPLPSPDLPDGTVRVRVVRSEITSVLENAEVVLKSADGKSSQQKRTGSTGHAEFQGLQQDVTYTLVARIEGKEIASRPFSMPTRGGLKFMLSGKAAGRSATEGSGVPVASTKDLSQLVLSPGSHLALEFGDAEVQVVAHMVIENRGTAHIDVGSEGLRFPLPEGFYGAQPASEDSQNLKLTEQGAFLKGPVPPGENILRFAYTLPTKGDELLLRQPIPIRAEGMRVIVEKMNGLSVEGPTAERAAERDFEGRTFLLVGHEHPTPAGQAVEVLLRGVPSHDRTLAHLSVILSVGMIAATVVLSRRKGKPA